METQATEVTPEQRGRIAAHVESGKSVATQNARQLGWIETRVHIEQLKGAVIKPTSIGPRSTLPDALAAARDWSRVGSVATIITEDRIGDERVAYVRVSLDGLVHCEVAPILPPLIGSRKARLGVWRVHHE